MRARVEGYNFKPDSDDEEETKTPSSTPTPEKPSEAEISEMEKQIELDKKQKTNQVLSSMLDGFKFTFKLEGLRVTLYGQDPPKF